jgi:hypothetical protein
VPFIGFWQRWRRKLLPHHENSTPDLRESEQQRNAVRRQVAKELNAIVTTPSPASTHRNAPLCCRSMKRASSSAR